MILTSCAEGNLETLRSVALESPQIIPLVMNKVINHSYKFNDATVSYVFNSLQLW